LQFGSGVLSLEPIDFSEAAFQKAAAGVRASIRCVERRARFGALGQRAGTRSSAVCGPMGAHGFYRQDGGVVAAINGFIHSR